MGAVTYFVRMVAKKGRAEEVQQLAAVEAHESGAAFLQYKEALRPLVEPDSVLFGNCVPVKVLGYSIEPSA